MHLSKQRLTLKDTTNSTYKIKKIYMFMLRQIQTYWQFRTMPILYINFMRQIYLLKEDGLTEFTIGKKGMAISTAASVTRFWMIPRWVFTPRLALKGIDVSSLESKQKGDLLILIIFINNTFKNLSRYSRNDRSIYFKQSELCYGGNYVVWFM